MNRLIKTAAIAAFGFACYKLGDLKGSIVTAAFSYEDAPKDIVHELAHSKHVPLWFNACCATLVEMNNKKFHEPDTDAPEEAD